MKAFSDMSIDELKEVQKIFYEIIEQIGKIVVQDYVTLLITIPNAIAAEIKKKEK